MDKAPLDASAFTAVAERPDNAADTASSSASTSPIDCCRSPGSLATIR